MTNTWSFHCNACGRCCNSAPRASLPELFHHAQRFIGALSVRRLVDDEGGLETALLHPGFRPGEWIELSTLAIDYPTPANCPALQRDGLCAIHFDRKPKACSAVPLDPLSVDARQHAVLAARSRGGREYIGADCIQPGRPPTFSLTVDDARIIDPRARRALAERRRDLKEDKRWWGDAVFDLLARGGLNAHLPADGMLTLPLAPVLRHVASLSPRSHDRCVEYLRVQQVLITQRIAAALLRKDKGDRAFTAQLRGMADTNAWLLRGLRAPLLSPPDAHAAEVWLNIEPGSTVPI